MCIRDSHCPAAVQHTGRRVDGIDLFRRDGYLREGDKLRIGQEAGEVGHKIASFLSNYPKAFRPFGFQ